MTRALAGLMVLLTGCAAHFSVGPLEQDPGPAPRVFISYSRADTVVADSIRELLELAGAVVYQDTRSINPGERWELEIERAIHEADAVLVIWSREAALSDWVSREWHEAVAHERTVVPVILRDAPPLPLNLEGYQAVGWR